MKDAAIPHQIDSYRQQMLEMYRQATPSPPIHTAEETWLDDRYPEPNIERDKAGLSPSSVPTPEALPTPSDVADFVGYLRVFTFTAGGAEPISDARAIITQSEGDVQAVFANLTTNRDGFTPVVALPSVNPALSLQPGSVQPYVTYTVRVTADGFQPVEHNNIPVYGDNYVTQPVAMTPLLPNKDAVVPQAFTSGGPANLQGGVL